MNKIGCTSYCCQREPLRQGFGFKGGSLTELWQVHVRIALENGVWATGQSVQSVLWSDGAVFAALGQQGNEKMLLITAYALELLKGMRMEAPPVMLQKMMPQLMAYGRQVTHTPALRQTFVLNALTGIDFCLWKLYRQQLGNPNFDQLCAPFWGEAAQHQNRLGQIPLLTYQTPEAEIRKLAESGSFLFKIKIGSNPGGRNDLKEMVQWDLERLAQIHGILCQYDTPWTNCGKPLYYLDANGRYDSRSRVEQFLDGAQKIGALERIALLEEPFPEEHLENVSGLGVAVAADESVHGAADAIERMDELGYGAMTLKPIAKTLSVTLEVLAEARKRGIPCFCADLTVNPAMVEVNKRLAASLEPLPGLKIGVFESNGAQNYANWETMKALSPARGESWAEPEGNCYWLHPAYYQADGNIWKEL